ncbi:MAG: DUF3841 domain-containing protein [Clostridiaceae bacterium]
MFGSDNIKVWTAQAKIVLDTIEDKGVYYVKREFIQKKYTEISKLFLEPYDWFVRHAAQKIPLPEGAEYAIWIYCDPQSISNYGSGDYIIEADIPKDKVILFDEGKWLKILNLSYIPENSYDDDRFREYITNQGLQHASKAFTSNFYPNIRHEIMRSWDRLFDDSIKLSEYTMGAVWELRKEWITNIAAPE